MKQEKWETKSKSGLLLIFIFTTIILLSGGFLYLKNEEIVYSKNAFKQLKNTTLLKANQIEGWRQQRLSDAKEIAQSPLLQDAVYNLINHLDKKELKSEIQQRLQIVIQNNPDFVNTLLTDTTGQILLTGKTGPTGLATTSTRKLVRKVITTNKEIFGDLYKSSPEGAVYTDIACPILNDQHKIVGSIVFRIDPNIRLCPILQASLIDSTEETFLFEKVGDSVSYLTDLRQWTNATLSLKIPLTSDENPAVMAIRNGPGFYEGIGYNEQKVLEYIQPISGTPWFLASKIDRDELFKPVYQRVKTITAILILLFLLLSAVLFMIIVYRRKHFYRQLLEDELQQAALKIHYKYIVKYANDIILLEDENLNIIEANERAQQTYQYSLEELQKMKVTDLEAPESKVQIKTWLKNITENNGTIVEAIHQRKDGSLLDVEISARIIQVDGRDFLHQVIRDITERKQTEIELKMQNLAFEAFTLAIIITDINGIIQWANSSFSRLSGYPISEIIGKNPNQIVKSGIQDKKFYETMWNTILSGRVWSGELINRRKDGSLFPEELTITPVMDINDKITSFIAIKIDITKRKEMELALLKSEERWHFAIEGSGDGAWDWNLITNEVFFSDQWKIMLGYSVPEIENKFDEWKRLVHPDDLKSFLSELDKHFNGETEFYANEYRMLCKDGNFKWILDRGKLIEWTPNGKPMRIIGTHKDITSRRLLEEQLRKAIEKEKELNELKSRFVATTSHEFRTPLASILMISDTLISHSEKMNIDQLSARLIKIKNHVLHLTDIVNNVLQLSKMQEGKIGFNPKDEDFIVMCHSIVDGFTSTKSAQGQIVFNSPFATLIVKIDDRLIIQAINNLISNAIKYSDEDICVKIELKLENNELIFSIQDKGIGIPEGDIKHLFTPFFRANNVSIIQGNGLGLSIVRESMLLHGGKVSCSNNADKGATFSLHFPVDLITTFSYARKE